MKHKLFEDIIKNKKLCSITTWLLKEIIAGLMVAAAVAGATLLIDDYRINQNEKAQLKSLHLGLSTQYIDSVFGIPMVQFYDASCSADISIYKQRNSVVWCAYVEDQAVAYVIIVKDRSNIYSVNAKRLKGAFLTKFSYADFSAKSQNPQINAAVNNDDYSYYSETYYGAGPADYNYYILGSYKSYFNKDDYNKLLLCCWSDTPDSEVEILRRSITPNAFGMIKAGYEETISLIPMGNDLRTYNDAIFGDWFD